MPAHEPRAVPQIATKTSLALQASALSALCCVFGGALVLYWIVGSSLSLGRGVIFAASLLLLVIYALVIRGLHHHHLEKFGFANLVTAIRAALVSIVAASVASPDTLHGAQSFLWALILLVVLSLILDGLDGYLARRYNQVSALGARFDMEIDALLIFTLSLAAYILGKAGSWVLLIGLMRYGFVVAQYLKPCLAAPLPQSFRRKLVCVIQVGVLCGLLMPHIDPPVSSSLAAVALLLLTASFARDSLYLLRRRESA
jgi:phosphatidylglycerophosphate synthase